MSENRIPLDPSNAVLPEVEVVGINDSVTAYQFVEGDFAGVTYTYSKIELIVVDAATGTPVERTPESVSPDDEDHALSINFEFVVFANDNNVDVQSDAFKQRIGENLTIILENGAALEQAA